ncbi:glycosyl hydrolase 115 family protein [Saccharopolyspora halophila]|uniref:Glycosyl hydrolase 115 family protein n=1 Tax=Saccharopolyspora halophila TaxID=405551 RepID=A0ABN3G0I4_9PSEU
MKNSGLPRRSFLTSSAAVAASAAAASTWGAPAFGAPGSGGRSRGYIDDRPGPGRFELVSGGEAAPVVVSGQDFPGVQRVAGDLGADIERVTGVAPEVITGEVPAGSTPVIVGTIGRSPLIRALVDAGKLDVSGIEGKWETSLEQVVAEPLPGVRRAFVIAGSDQRGTIFGAYDVSREIGVSPWYWWADAAPQRRDELHVLPGRHSQGTPAVRYRGFFINDENPALGNWAPEHFGPGKDPDHPNGFNSAFYAKVFEVMLRLKANYLWPAVWGRAFAEDDPENHRVATEYGVIMGTSHEAPMMRGIEEWNRHATPAERDDDGEIVTPGSDPYGGTGEWSYRYNAQAVEAYWADGIRRMVEQGFEGVVTLGMRGPGDVGLPDGDGIELMQRILDAQRRILREVAGGDITRVPQVQTLYKEVQRYWDKGLRPPDDVTVVLCDDNWANMRKLPDLDLPERSGGYGVYYHFDYVGAGRNYKWVDTALPPNVWDQLNQCYSYGARELWVVNAGDMKGNELPLQFFLDYAWDPEGLPVERIGEWERDFARQNFAPEQASAIGAVLHEYGNLQSRRKPELLNRRITLSPSGEVINDDEMTPFSLVDYREIDRVTEEWTALAAETDRIAALLPAEQQDGYYQLVSYRVQATANLYQLRRAEFRNLHYAAQGRAATNALADDTDGFFAADQAMSARYDELGGGKWKGFQSQAKIGYGDVERYGPDASWQQPEIDGVALPDEVFPEVRRIEVPAGAEMGVAIDGSEQWWSAADGDAVLPVFSPYQSQPAQYIEVFNRGSAPFGYRIEPAEPWVLVDNAGGTVEQQIRAELRVDFDRAPHGRTTVPVTVSGPDGASVRVLAVVDKPKVRSRDLSGFVEANGYISMNAEHYDRRRGGAGARWKRIPGLGRDSDGVEPFPVTAPSARPGRGPLLEYRMTTFTAGEVTVWAYLSPRNPALAADGLRYAVSIDDGEPQIVDIIAATGSDDAEMNDNWARNTSDNVNRTATTHTLDRPGVHVLKIRMIDPTVVVQKIVIDTGGLRPSYLGPPESHRT